MNSLEEQLNNAVHINDLKEVKQLIKAGANIHKGNSSPLNWACWANHIEIASLLLEKGAMIKPTTFKWAAERGSLEALKLLVDRGAKIPKEAAEIALKCGRTEVFEYLTNQTRLQKLKRLENV